MQRHRHRKERGAGGASALGNAAEAAAATRGYFVGPFAKLNAAGVRARRAGGGSGAPRDGGSANVFGVGVGGNAGARLQDAAQIYGAEIRKRAPAQTPLLQQHCGGGGGAAGGAGGWRRRSPDGDSQPVVLDGDDAEL